MQRRPLPTARLRQLNINCSACLLAALLPLQAFAGPAEELKLNQIEQTIRDLQRQLQMQSQRLERLENQPGPSSPGVAPSPSTRTPAPPSTAPWMVAKNWQRVQIGMPELEVVGILGPPTQTRAGDKPQSIVAFYAMEIGDGGFLTGHIAFENKRVTAVQKPELR